MPFEVWFLTDHGVTPSYDQEFKKTFAWDLDLLSGYQHRFLRTGDVPDSFFQMRLPRSFADMLKEAGATSLWIQGWQVAAYWQAAWISKQAGIPVWLRGETNDLSSVPVWKRLPKRFLLRALFHQIDRFLFIGSANRRFYKQYGVPDRKLRPAPYCVDNQRFSVQANEYRKQRADLRRQFSIPEDAFCILFCGKLIQKKRPLDVVAAASLMAAQGDRYHILFVGSGELEGDVRRACAVSEKATGCTSSFAGFLNQNEIAKAYVAADCMVLPSDSGETWGLVVNEALASGLACVVSDACGSAEDLVLPADPGLVFECGNISGQAAALRRVQLERDAHSLTWTVATHDFKATIQTVVETFHVAQRDEAGAHS